MGLPLFIEKGRCQWPFLGIIKNDVKKKCCQKTKTNEMH